LTYRSHSIPTASDCPEFTTDIDFIGLETLTHVAKKDAENAIRVIIRRDRMEQKEELVTVIRKEALALMR